MSEQEPTWSYPTALRVLWDRSAYDRGYISDPFADADSAARGLRRVVRLLDRLDRPHERFAIAHVAGSKGKGSTSAMIATALLRAGYQVGLSTSPHLHSWRERININGEPIDAPTFAALTKRVIAEAEALEGEEPDLGPLTTFEAVTAMGFTAFAAAGCDVAVVEVGLGGSYDATNVVIPTVAAITRLDLEHTAVLGSHLVDIAVAKAGIVKPGRPVVVSPQADDALAVIATIATERGSPVWVGGRDWQWDGTWQGFAASGPWGYYPGLRLNLPGPHQVENACTAIAALWCLDRAGIAVPETAIADGLAAVNWPGRFERVRTDAGPTFILDSAHTPAATAALAATLASEFPGRFATIVLGTSADKDVASLVRPLAPIATTLISTRSSNPRAASAEVVAAGVRTSGLETEIAADVSSAVARAINVAGVNGLVVVTGSLFTVAEAREALGLATPDPPIADPV